MRETYIWTKKYATKWKIKTNESVMNPNIGELDYDVSTRQDVSIK